MAIGRAEPIDRGARQRSADVGHRAPDAAMFGVGDEATRRRFYELFSNGLQNEHTRRAYFTAVHSFAAWASQNGLRQPQDVTPASLRTYAGELGQTRSAQTVRLHLAAIRRLFDWMADEWGIEYNPAHSHDVHRPPIPEPRGPFIPSAAAVRRLFASIETDTIIGLRDRAICGLIVYAFARPEAVASMKLRDFIRDEAGPMVRVQGGRDHRFRRLPAHRVLVGYLEQYVAAAGLQDEYLPLFRIMRKGRSSTDDLPDGLALELRQMSTHVLQQRFIGERPLHGSSVRAVLRRRCNAAGLDEEINSESLRAAALRRYLECGGFEDDARAIAGDLSLNVERYVVSTLKRSIREEIERLRF